MSNPAPVSLRLFRLAGVALLAALPVRMAATNGMNMEGYGPIATAMGGASLAYDNGTAAVINNPATLALMPEAARLDVALGLLGPQVTAAAPNGVSTGSESKSFLMPALGYVRKSGPFTYGLAVFGQGGMGCQFGANSWAGLGFGLENRTEVSVGRVIAPVAFKVNDTLSVAATIDFVWAGMDLKMALPGAQFMDLVSTQHIGTASGTIVQGFGQMMQQMPAGASVDYAYFNFSNSSNFTGEARGTGYAGKIGLVYTPTSTLRLGLTYHTETELSDLTARGDSISFQLNVPGMGHVPQALVGDIRVRDFEWPAMLGAGFAWTPTSRWLIAGDVREVYWSGVMKSFNLGFVASAAAGNGGFAGGALNAQLYQNWSDQTVYQLGAAYRVSDSFTVRFGGNYAQDPIPAQYLNPLFPATVEKHLSIGGSWRITPASSIHASYVHGFERTVTNGGGVIVAHAQNNAQVMYSYSF